MRIILFTISLFCLISFRQIEATSQTDYINWWQNYRNHPKMPSDLKIMEDYFISSGLIDYSSNYWNYLNQMNIEQIVNYGYENFKQTVTRNYFTWVVSIDNPYASNLKAYVPHPQRKLSRAEIYKIYPIFGVEESIKYNTITEYFINYFYLIHQESYLARIEEPLIGNPPYTMWNGKRISQDILNSLLEYLPISQNCPMDEVQTVIEVGAGSGRTAFCFLTLHPNIKYVIVDFPPALYISQKYLSAVFSDRKVMQFRPFESFDEVKEEYSQANIVFITPNQLSKIPNQSADLFLAIDCLHEMKEDRIVFYFQEAKRLCNYMYFKCWLKTIVPFDNIPYLQQSYPVPSDWEELFNEPCVVPSDFFHAFYRTGN